VIARGTGGGWQTVIADLALILFMVSVSAMGDGEAADKAQQQAEALENPLPAQGEPIGIYRAGAGAPPIAEWLDQLQPDPRQRLTIMARYTEGGSDEAARAALDLSRQAGDRAGRARILIEPGETPELLAVLAYDDSQNGWHDDCINPGEGGALAAKQGDSPCE